MASKERENFCRNAILIVDHAKDSLVDVFELHLTKNNLSFEDFIKDHLHVIYHLCFNKKKCCQCPKGYVLPQYRVLYPLQLEILLDKYGVRCSHQCPIGPADFCCCLAKPGVTTNVLDITLARCLLINFCDDVFRKSSSLQNNIKTLVEMRNNVYGHAKEGTITDVNYGTYKNEIESAILEIAKVCGNETEKKQILMDLEKRSLDGTLCIQYQNTMLEQIAKETRLEEKVDDLTDKMPEIVENAVLKALDCYTKQKLTKGTTEELEALSNLKIKTENQQGTTEELEALSNLKIKTENQQDDQDGAMASSSQESSSNNISTGNDQSGQGYQSSIETDAEPYISSVNNDLENKRDDQAGAMASSSQESSSNNISTGNDQSSQDIYDGVVLHAEDDRDAAIKFIRNMERENPDLNINIILYENLDPGTSELESPAKCFDSCRYVFVFVTHNFVKADLERFLSESAMIETLTFREKKARLIPVKADKTNLSALAPLKSLKYYHYLETKESQHGPDRHFIEGFVKLINNGRKEYLVN